MSVATPIGALPGRRLDVIVALFLATTLTAITYFALDGTANTGGLICAAACGLAYALRSRAPMATFLIAHLSVLVYVLVDRQSGPIWAGAFGSMLVLVAATPPRVWWPLITGAVVLLGLGVTIGGGFDVHVLLFAGMWLIAARTFGEIVALRAQRETELEATRRAEAESQIAQERVRIARDLHDAVGHSLAAIALRAGVANHLLDRDTTQARDAVAAIRTLARDSLGELGAIVGVLRDGEGAAPRAPTPGLTRLRALVDDMRDAGLDAELDAAPVDGVPDVVATAGYRIVQEALTNVARHAGDGAKATVRVARENGSLAIAVDDDGSGIPGEPGHGVLGMRERAAAVGGALEAGPRQGGGWSVRATLPV